MNENKNLLSAPGLGSPLPTSAPGLGSPLPYLRRAAGPVLLFSLCVLVGRNGEEIMDSLTTLKIENLVAGTAAAMLIWRLGKGDQGVKGYG